MSNVHHVDNAEEFAEILATNDDVVVEFSAPAWCDPCRKLLPHFEATADRVPDVKFLYEDIDELPTLANNYGIMSVPTVLRFRDGDRETITSRTSIKLVQELGE